VEPSEIGFNRITADRIAGGNTVEDSAAIFHRIINGNGTREECNVVVANSAIALTLLHPSKTVEECVSMARESLESGKARQTFKRLIDLQ
jgi:anthranilate phosphoribosyltransferase